jgi:hypothetical protein
MREAQASSRSRDGVGATKTIDREPTAPGTPCLAPQGYRSTAHIRRLRVKLGPARDHIETVVGLGYRFVK